MNIFSCKLWFIMIDGMGSTSLEQETEGSSPVNGPRDGGPSLKLKTLGCLGPRSMCCWFGGEWDNALLTKSFVSSILIFLRIVYWRNINTHMTPCEAKKSNTCGLFPTSGRMEDYWAIGLPSIWKTIEDHGLFKPTCWTTALKVEVKDLGSLSL